MTPNEEYSKELADIREAQDKLNTRSRIANERLARAQKACKHNNIESGFLMNTCKDCGDDDYYGTL